MKMEIKRYLRAAADLVLPRVCAVCGERLNLAEEHICLGCLADMPLTRFWERGHNPMADKFNEKVQRWVEEVDETARSGREVGRERYAYAAALFFYHSEAGYRHIPYQIKYHGNTELGKYFGWILGKKLAGNREVREPKQGDSNHEKEEEETGNGRWRDDARIWSDVDMVIPVPLHWTRRWKRGYNQAEVIAGAGAEAMGVPMRSDILVRSRRTKTQVKLGIEDKAKNVNGAFVVAEWVRKTMNPGKGRWNGKGSNPCDDLLNNVHHIVIVDDVFTTGSTLAACFKALREVFPPEVRISAVTLGYLER